MAPNAQNPNHPSYYQVRLRTEEEVIKWNTLVRRRTIPTKYLDRRVIARWRVHDPIVDCLKRAGVKRLVERPYYTHKGLVLEFFTTLQKVGTRNITSIKFRMRNQDLELTPEAFDDHFGLFEEDVPEGHPFDIDKWWLMITEPIDPPDHAPKWPSSRAKASRIRNPIFRILQLIFRNCVFPRKDAGSINSTEMYLLWVGISGCKSVLGIEIFRALLRVASDSSDDILCGGMITLLAEIAQVNVAGMDVVPGSIYVDDQNMVNASICGEGASHSRFWRMIRGSDAFYLPVSSDNLIYFTRSSNLNLRHTTHLQALRATNIGMRELHNSVHIPDPMSTPPAPGSPANFAPEILFMLQADEDDDDDDDEGNNPPDAPDFPGGGGGDMHQTSTSYVPDPDVPSSSRASRLAYRRQRTETGSVSFNLEDEVRFLRTGYEQLRVGQAEMRQVVDQMSPTLERMERRQENFIRVWYRSMGMEPPPDL